MQKYVFRKYNSEYKVFFKSEKRKITYSLGQIAKIEHVGSTSIPNLGGKGIIDISLGVLKSKIPEAKRKLEEAGYEFREKASCPDKLFFRIDYPYKNRKRRIHIHLTKLNGQDWKEKIGFRDYLLKHPEDVRHYIRIKKEAVKKALGNGDIYMKHKEAFIKNILKKY